MGKCLLLSDLSPFKLALTPWGKKSQLLIMELIFSHFVKLMVRQGQSVVTSRSLKWLLHKGTREGMTELDLPAVPQGTRYSPQPWPFLPAFLWPCCNKWHPFTCQASHAAAPLTRATCYHRSTPKKTQTSPLGITQCIPVPSQPVFVQYFKYTKRYINVNYYYNVPLLPVNSPHRPTDTFPTSRFSTFVASETTLFSFTLPFAIWSPPSGALNSLHYYEGLLELVPNHSRNNPWWLVSDCVCECLCNRALWLA